METSPLPNRKIANSKNRKFSLVAFPSANSHIRNIATPNSILRLGTRGSMLARAQSQLIANQLMQLHPTLHVELVIIKTTGDRVTDRPLAEIGGKGLFTKELELALLSEQIDFAVHSYKDVPVTMPLVAEAVNELVIASVPPRESPWDVIVAANEAALVAEVLPPHARVGTSSPRRTAQLLSIAPTIEILPLRGNIDTRLRKLREGEFDRIVLAHAGLIRAGLFDAKMMRVLDIIPSPGQGALALQCRRLDVRTIEILRSLHDPETELCVNVERAVVLALNGDCHSPIAAHARVVDNQTLHLQIAAAALERGSAMVYESQRIDRSNAKQSAFSLGKKVESAMARSAHATQS